jgi:hypothetical protein
MMPLSLDHQEHVVSDLALESGYIIGDSQKIIRVDVNSEAVRGRFIRGRRVVITSQMSRQLKWIKGLSAKPGERLFDHAP